MKLSYYILTIVILICILSCAEYDKNAIDLDLIRFDVTKKYPKKEMEIHDLAEISYVVLQAKEGYLFEYPLATITDNYIIIENLNGQEFLFFDRLGKPVSKVYRIGEGPEEYIRADKFFYVDEEDNLYVVVWSNSKIKVYNKNGLFKKEYSTPDPEDMRIEGIYNYDEKNLLLYFAEQQTPFALFSKTDGNITFLTDIFIKEPKDMLLRFNNGFFYFQGYYVVKNNADFLLTEYGLDTTVYRMTPDKDLFPALVREPSFDETDPKIALHSFIETSEYLFFSSVRMEYDKETYLPHPKTAYLIDKSKKQVYSQYITNKDFEGKELVIDPSTVNTFISPYVGKAYYDVEELTEANKRNKLKGKLKEAFDRMTEDDEYIFMIYQLN